MGYTSAQAKQFINQIAPLIKAEAKKRGYKVCSTVIAQAIIESACGTSSLGYKYHNYFGMKCGSSWRGASVNLSTKEEYKAGVLTNIKANFRAYSSMEAGVAGYFDFISTSRYANLKTANTYKEYAERLKADGYATSSTYVNTLISTVNKYDLTKYDVVETVVTNDSAFTTFVKGVQSALKVTVDGIAGSKTLGATITVSAKKNNRHAVVKVLQAYLNSLGYDCGTADGIAGAKFTNAVKSYQKANGCVADGEITAKGKTWRMLLRM